MKAKSSEAASSDLVMAVGASDVSVVDGVKIQQRTYTNDTTYIDEWLFYAFGPDAFLLGVNASESGHDHHSVLTTITPILHSLGYDSLNCVVTDSISLTDTQNHLEACEVFVSRSHGGSDSSGTFICLDKNETIYLGTSQIYNFSTNTAVVNLSNCDLAIFVGCQTAAVEGTSLPDAAVAAGALYAIGFEEEINCDSASNWTQLFFEYYSQGYSVPKSAQLAADDCSSTSGIRSIRVVSEK